MVLALLPVPLSGTLESSLTRIRHLNHISNRSPGWLSFSLLIFKKKKNQDHLYNLDQSDTEKLIHAFITSKLHYCNAILAGCPNNSAKMLSKCCCLRLLLQKQNHTEFSSSTFVTCSVENRFQNSPNDTHSPNTWSHLILTSHCTFLSRSQNQRWPPKWW